MLALIHESQMGTEKTKARARNTLYWPGMSEAIDKKVADCSTCLKYGNANQKEPLIPHPVPMEPRQKVGADILTCHGKDCILIVDGYSKYLELLELSDKTAVAVISKKKETFARHDIPETTDEWLHAVACSRECRSFTKIWGIQQSDVKPYTCSV